MWKALGAAVAAIRWVFFYWTGLTSTSSLRQAYRSTLCIIRQCNPAPRLVPRRGGPGSRHCKALGHPQHRNSAIRAKHQQVFVPGDYGCGSRRNGTSKHVVVIAIARYGSGQRSGCHQHGKAGIVGGVLQRSLAGGFQSGRQTRLGERLLQFVQKRLAGEQPNIVG